MKVLAIVLALCLCVTRTTTATAGEPEAAYAIAIATELEESARTDITNLQAATSALRSKMNITQLGFDFKRDRMSIEDRATVQTAITAAALILIYCEDSTPENYPEDDGGFLYRADNAHEAGVETLTSAEDNYGTEDYDDAEQDADEANGDFQSAIGLALVGWIYCQTGDELLNDALLLLLTY
jgi:hypothetical protein